MDYRKRRRLRRDGRCPTCGAVPSHWTKSPRSAVSDTAVVVPMAERVPADLVGDYDPRDVFRCPRCGFMGCVSEHPEDADGYIDWDDWEYGPDYCPRCGARMEG